MKETKDKKKTLKAAWGKGGEAWGKEGKRRGRDPYTSKNKEEN